MIGYRLRKRGRERESEIDWGRESEKEIVREC